MLIALGIITLFIRPLKHKVEQTAVIRAPPQLAKEPPPPLPAPVTNRTPAAFPKLKLQGIIFRETRPYAIINARSYTIGDRVEELHVRAIDRASVTLELQGDLLVLTLK